MPSLGEFSCHYTTNTGKKIAEASMKTLRNLALKVESYFQFCYNIKKALAWRQGKRHHQPVHLEMPAKPYINQAVFDFLKFTN